MIRWPHENGEFLRLFVIGRAVVVEVRLKVSKILAGITNTRLTRVSGYVPECPEMSFLAH